MFQRLKNPKHHDAIALIVLSIAAISFYATTYDRSSYSYILRADEGVSFATSLRTTEGFVPQHDFPSYYGPLMPYFYGVIFRLFSPSIALMRALWAGMYIVSVLLFYLLGRHIMPALAAFAAAAMLIGQQHTPLYTYNHIGLILAIEGILLLLFQRISGTNVPYFRIVLAFLLLIALLVKFNEAFVVFGLLVATLWVLRSVQARPSQPEHPAASIQLRDFFIPGVFAAIGFAVITFALNIGLTKSQFLRNFPVLPQYQASIGGYRYVKLILSIPFKTPWQQMTARRWYVLWFENYIFAILVSFAVGVMVLYCLLRFAASRKFRLRVQDAWKPALLLVVAIGTYHEFYLTGNHWSTPIYAGFSLLALTFFLWRALARFPLVRMTAVFMLVLVCVTADAYYLRIVHQTYSQYYFDSSRAHIYTSNDSDAPTVAEVVNFLHQAVPANQSLAAFPHDALLIYLSGHKNAMRDDDYQWMLFPTLESDMEIVQELESKKVSKILISNFVGIKHGQPVIFGRDYLPETFKYIQAHYSVIKAFGTNPRGYHVDYLELVDAAPATSIGQ